jgi:hypothetical protein
VAAGAFGFLIFSHTFEGPDLYGASSFFETIRRPRRKARERSLSNYILWLIQRDLDHDDVEKGKAPRKPRR